MTELSDLAAVAAVDVVEGDVVDLGALGRTGYGTVIGTVHDPDAGTVWILTTCEGDIRARIVALEHSLVPLHITPDNEGETDD